MATRAYSSKPATAAEIELWQKLSYGGVALVVVVSLIVFSIPTEHGHMKKSSHTHIRKKPFPWGDGNTSLFDMLKKKDHGHDDHH